MATALDSLDAANAAAVRSYVVTHGDSGTGSGWAVDTLTFPATTQVSGALFSEMVPFHIETGVTKFSGETRSDAVMAIGYNVDVGAGRKDTNEPGIGLFVESDYWDGSSRKSEMYFAHRGGSTDSHNRPLFFQWHRETGVLNAAQVHAAGANGATGFRVYAPTGGAGEQGGLLHNLARNTLDIYCHDTAATAYLNIGTSGSTGSEGCLNMYREGSVFFSLLPVNTTQMGMTINTTECFYFGRGTSGGNTGGFLGIGTSTNTAQINQDMSANGTAAIGHRIKLRSGATGNAVEILDSSNAINFAIDANFNVIPKAGAASQTQGFVCVPSGAGAAGTPATLPTGTAPMFVDTSGSRVGFYFGGGWKYAALA